MTNEKELIKDKESFNPANSTNEVLLDDHRILHAWWEIEAKGGDIKNWSKEDIFNAHELAAQEMTKRKLGITKEGKHASPLPQTLETSFEDGEKGKGKMIFLPNILSGFRGDLIISENFISIVGGLCNHGRTKGEIGILLKTQEPKENSQIGVEIQSKLTRSLARMGISEKRMHFLYGDLSEQPTNHVNIFDLILRLKPIRELHEITQKLKRQTSTKHKKLANDELSSVQKADIGKLIKGDVSLSDVARLVGCSKSTVIYHSRK